MGFDSPMLTMEKDRDIDLDIIDTIIEKPISFKIGRRYFYLYPPTLGKLYLIQRILSVINITKKEQNDEYRLALALCLRHRNEISRVLAIHTLREVNDIYNDEIVNSRAKEIVKLSTEDMAQLYIVSNSWGSVEEFSKHLGIDKETEKKRRVSDVKNDGNTITLGGVSILGSLIDFVCERYGWSYQYVLWGISYSSLRLMTSDISTSTHLTKEERRKAGVHGGNTIKMDDPANKELIRHMVKNAFD